MNKPGDLVANVIFRNQFLAFYFILKKNERVINQFYDVIIAVNIT